jgi:hypothetical protein
MIGIGEPQGEDLQCGVAGSPQLNFPPHCSMKRAKKAAK